MRIASLDQKTDSIQMAVKYIQERQTPDGGYFFACIPPGNLLDTFFAIKSLHILGLKPKRIASVESFVSSFESDYANGNIHALYLAIEIYLAMGKTMDRFRNFGKIALSRFRPDELRQFDRLDIEVVSELKSIFEAVVLFVNLNLQFDNKFITDLILSLHNADGGFGRNLRSTLATTFYAIQTLNLMRYPRNISESTLAYLGEKEKEIYYIEDLYYWIMTRSALGNRPSHIEREKTISLVLDFQGTWGGFARGRIMGIQTLEYTYYAISLLELLKTT